MSDLNVNSNMYVDDPMVHSNDIYNKGLDLTEHAEYEKAISVFSQYQKYHPEDPNVFSELAICHYSMQEYDQALKLIERAIKLSKNNGLAIKMKGLILKELYCLQQAMTLLEYGNVLLPSDEDILFGLLEIYIEMNFYEAGFSCLKQLLLINPTTIDYLLYEVKFCVDFHHNTKAQVLMQKLLADYPNNDEVLAISIYLDKQKTRNVGCRYMGMNN